MFLSFVIPLYNADRYIAVALDSIYQVTLDSSEYELIVMDNSSTDIFTFKYSQVRYAYSFTVNTDTSFRKH